jgi:hypothetical protein
MLNFGKAILAYSKGETPESYPGIFTKKIADAIGNGLPDDIDPVLVGEFGARWAQVSHRQDLETFGVTFDSWTSESELNNPAVAVFRYLCALGQIYINGKNGLKICGACARPHDNQETPGNCPLCLGIISIAGVPDSQVRELFGKSFLIDPNEDEDEKSYRVWRQGGTLELEEKIVANTEQSARFPTTSDVVGKKKRYVAKNSSPNGQW